VVRDVVNVENLPEAARCVLKLVEMEGLALVEFVAIGGPNDVRMLILLSPPASAVPQLAVALIAGHQVVGLHLHVQQLCCVEVLRGLSRSEVGLVVDLGTLVAETESGC